MSIGSRFINWIGTYAQRAPHVEMKPIALGVRLRRKSVVVQMQQITEINKFLEATIEANMDKFARQGCAVFTYTRYVNHTFSIVTHEDAKYTGVGPCDFATVVKNFAAAHQLVSKCQSNQYTLTW